MQVRHHNEPLPLAVLQYLLAALLLLFLTLPAAAQGLPNLAALEARGAVVSALVVDLQSGQEIASLNADRQVTPASVTKLVTATRALDIWGADHRFSTRLAATAAPTQGRLPGDLLLIGGADPAMTEETLWHFARTLAQQGIRDVSGDIIIDASRFGQVACSLRDRCDALQQSTHSYAAPLSAAGVNFSTVAMRLLPGAQAGQEAQVRPEPFSLPSFKVATEATTSHGGGIELTAIHRNLGDSERTEIRGGLPSDNSGLLLRRSVAHPERLTGEMLQILLEREGIAIGGGLRFTYQPHPYEVVLAEQESRSLAELLKGMMYYSTNYTADVLALELARSVGQSAPLALPEAGAALSRYLHDVMARSRFGAGTPPATSLRDGSGLDPDNRVSAREVIALLDEAYRRLDLFQPLLGSLSVPLHARGSLLQGGDPSWAMSVAGKTGGLSVPRSVTSYAGYLRFLDGGWGAFAFFVNGTPGHPIPRADAFQAMRQDYASFRAGGS